MFSFDRSLIDLSKSIFGGLETPPWVIPCGPPFLSKQDLLGRKLNGDKRESEISKKLR